MKSVELCDEYYFSNIKFGKYHHTDMRAGTPVNYIAYMKKGKAKIVCSSKTIYVNEGDVFFIPKGLCYQSYWYGEDDIDFLSFGFLRLAANCSTNFDLQIVADSHELRHKLMQIPVNDSSIDCKTLSLFYDAMSTAVPILKYSPDCREEPIIDRIKLCIQNNPDASLRDVAALCSVSEPYMYSLFKRHEKTTPNSYRQRVLCMMATELLTTTDKSVEEISSMLNFSSSSYFRKILKKHTGSTPLGIRKNSIF